MGAPSPNTPAPDILSAPTLPLANRYQLLDGLTDEEGVAKPNPTFQALGVYKPPHMRTPSESVALATGSDPTADNTSTVHPWHGSNPDGEEKVISRPRTPCADPTPASAPVFGFDEMKKLIQNKVMAARKAATELEMVEKELLKEEERCEYGIRMLKDAGLNENEIREVVGWPTPASSRPRHAKPMGIDSIATDLTRVNLGTEQEIERPAEAYERKKLHRADEDLTNKTPTPGGPMYSSADGLGGVHQTGKYGRATPFTAPSDDIQPDAATQAMVWNEQVQNHPGTMNRYGQISSGPQAPGQIYQTAPVSRFGSSVHSLPPRFRQALAIQQLIPPRRRNIIQNNQKDAVPASHPAPWPPVLPQNPVSNDIRPVSNPPPRPYFYEVDLVFDFEGVALSSNCNRDVFVKTYWKANGFAPSQAAWAAWASVVEKVEREKREQQYEYQKAMEKEAKQRYGAGSRLTKWSSNFVDDPPATEQGYSSSSSDSSTKVASSRNSEVGDEGGMFAGLAGWNGGRKIEMPPVMKPWKDIADETWAFGEPPRSDDPQHYMTHAVRNAGWQAHGPRRE